MKETFFGFYRPSNEELSELWNSGTFILDANVLLNLYRYPKEARDDLLRILKTVSNRLWVPHQAALEYQENRLSVMAEQVRRYDEVGKVLEDARRKLRAGLGHLQLKRRHSLIDADTFLERVDRVFDDFLSELETLEQEQPDVFDDDQLRDEIDSLLEGRVGSPPESQQELDKIYEDGKIRYDQKRPPGYMDEGKSDGDEREAYLYQGLYFKRKYGDLILWYEIIKEVQSREELEQIIFVTDDDKEDWWWKVKSEGWKTVGPRPELVEEISSKAGVSTFYMYNSERFMRFASDHLGVQVSAKSIDQVRVIARLRSIRRDETETTERYRKELRNVLRVSDSVDIYFSPENGTLLVKVDIGDDDTVGTFYSIAKVDSGKPVARTEPVEITAFAAPSSYWQMKIDAGYKSLPRTLADAAGDESLPIILTALRSTAEKLHADGLDGVADAIESVLAQSAA